MSNVFHHYITLQYFIIMNHHLNANYLGIKLLNMNQKINNGYKCFLLHTSTLIRSAHSNVRWFDVIVLPGKS